MDVSGDRPFLRHRDTDCHRNHIILCVFEKLGKSTSSSFVMSVRPSVRAHATARLPLDGASLTRNVLIFWGRQVVQLLSSWNTSDVIAMICTDATFVIFGLACHRMFVRKSIVSLWLICLWNVIRYVDWFIAGRWGLYDRSCLLGYIIQLQAILTLRATFSISNEVSHWNSIPGFNYK